MLKAPFRQAQPHLFLRLVLRCRAVPPRRRRSSNVQHLNNARVLVETLYQSSSAGEARAWTLPTVGRVNYPTSALYMCPGTQRRSREMRLSKTCRFTIRSACRTCRLRRDGRRARSAGYLARPPQTRNASRTGNVVEGQSPIQPRRWNLCLFWLHPSARPHVHFPAEDGWKVGSAFGAFDGSRRMMSHSTGAEDDTPRRAVSLHGCVARTGYPWPIYISQRPRPNISRVDSSAVATMALRAEIMRGWVCQGIDIHYPTGLRHPPCRTCPVLHALLPLVAGLPIVACLLGPNAD